MNSPIEEIKARLDIVEFIQGYVRLHKAGINYKANCPFHGEKTPSFFVSPARQMWHCFGCGRGGDVFKFLTEIEGHDFPEALRVLAQRTGVTLKREDPRIRSERNLLYDINEDAARMFEETLAKTPAAKSYLRARGLLDETVKEFRVGFAPQSWDFLLRALTEKGFKKEDIEKAGLIIKSEDRSSWYDRFRGRIMFPIADANGRVIGFGGRIFEAISDKQQATRNPNIMSHIASEHVAKYVNTPATLIYDKSRVLYGFDRAKQEIRSHNRVAVVEGYMDCVMSHQAGVRHTVAVSGTALTPEQLKMLRRLSETMIASFDTDAAGDSATKRSLALAAQFDFERRIVHIPSGKDPADTVAQDPALWRQAVDAAEPVVDFYFKKAFAEHDPKTVDGKKAISALLLPFIAELSREIEKAHWVSELSRRLQAPEESIWKDLKRAKTNEFVHERRDNDTVPVAPPRRRDLLEEHVLALLTLASEEARRRELEKRDIEFVSALHGELFAALRQEPPVLAAHLESPFQMLKFKSEILSQTISDIEAELGVSLRCLEIESLKERRAQKTEELARKQEEGDEEAHNRILREIGEMNAKLTAIDKAPPPRFFAKRVL